MRRRRWWHDVPAAERAERADVSRFPGNGSWERDLDTPGQCAVALPWGQLWRPCSQSALHAGNRLCFNHRDWEGRPGWPDVPRPAAVRRAAHPAARTARPAGPTCVNPLCGASLRSEARYRLVLAQPSDQPGKSWQFCGPTCLGVWLGSVASQMDGRSGDGGGRVVSRWPSLPWYKRYGLHLLTNAGFQRLSTEAVGIHALLGDIAATQGGSFESREEAEELLKRLWHGKERGASPPW